MISIFLQAGLGNQLFQLYTAIAYAMEHNEKLIIPEYKWDSEKRPSYWESIFNRLKPAIDPNLKPGSLVRLKEEGFHYMPLPKKTNVILFGYFQSYKYFDKHAEAISKKLNIPAIPSNMLEIGLLDITKLFLVLIIFLTKKANFILFNKKFFTNDLE